MKDICVLCHCKLPDGHPGRNNPRPVASEGECCDECNYRIVIPARLVRLRAQALNRDEIDAE